MTCSVTTFSVAGTVSGAAAGHTVELQNNGVNTLTVVADGNFQFPPLADGSAYAVSVSAQPAGQTCTVSNGSGTVSGANVTDVAVKCVDDVVPPPVFAEPIPVPVDSRPALGLLVLMFLIIGVTSLNRRL